MTATNTKTGNDVAAKKTAVIGAGVNLFLAAVKVTGGLFSGSAALLADGIHSLADLLSDVFTYVMLSISHADADDSHPYGHGKFETLGTLVLSIALIFSALWIIWHALESFHSPSILSSGGLALGITVLSILANEGLFHYTRKVGERVGSQLVIANAWHHRADSLSSIAAMIGIGLSLAGYPVFDAVAAIIVAFFLIKVAWGLGREALDELMDAAVEEDLQEKMYELIRETEGVAGCHFLRARTLGGKIFVDVHVDVAPYISVTEGHNIAEIVEYSLKTGLENIADVVVHIDPENISHMPHDENFSRKSLEKAVKASLKKNLPEQKMRQLILHIFDNALHAEIHLTSKKPPSSQQTKDLTAILSKPSGPFDEVTLLFVLN